MYKEQDLTETLQNYVDENEMAGGVLIVRKNGKEIYRNKWGYADVLKKQKADYDTMFRLASMTKPVTAIGIMQLEEKGLLHLDDPVNMYLPEFKNQTVFAKKIGIMGDYIPDDDFPEDMPLNEVTEKTIKMKPVPAERPVTIRDLLSHSSGMGMSMAGSAYVSQNLNLKHNLKQRVESWANLSLDFQPGTDTGYSAVVGFDILGRVIEVVSGEDLSEYFKNHIFSPLGISDMTFCLDESQEKRKAKMYHSENGKLYIEPDTATAPAMYELLDETDARYAGYFSGSAGLWGSAEAYDKIVTMFAQKGVLDNVRILEEKTVERMHSEGAKDYMEPVFMPGTVWGLGLLRFVDPERLPCSVNAETYGWSGAFGTHMFIDDQSGLSATFMMSRYNIGGGASYIARKLEELIFGIWNEKE